MKYTVNLANNLKTLFPALPVQCTVESPAPLTIYQIAGQAGVPSLLLVGGIIDGTLCKLDMPVEEDCELVLLGPVAGG